MAHVQNVTVLFRVTAAVEIERSQIKTIQYFQKNIKLEYLSQIKLAGGHRAHITVFSKLFESNIALSKKEIYLLMQYIG